uniref:DBF4-type domain-containing protein n=1 Tax=Erpetoichthys calabaricus TaxID=27687 RepID=A0A8C4SKB6_ERPCA
MKQTPVKDLEAPLPLSRQVFAGRSFYLDVPKSKHLTLVVEAIGKMGGTIESFLSKEVSYLVTASREACQGRVTKRNEKCRSVGSVNSSSQTSKKSVQSAGSQKPADSMQTSRGRALLEKVIKNNMEKADGGGVLANARSWGVKILHVNDLLEYIKKTSLSNSQVKKKPSESKGPTDPSASTPRKAMTLKEPFVKIEDCSRRYKPLHLHFDSFPEVKFTGTTRHSPFESAPIVQREQGPRVPQVESHGLTTSDGKREKPESPAAGMQVTTHGCANRKRQGFCECCQETFWDQQEHLLSEKHRSFVLESSHYAVVDRVVQQLCSDFEEIPVHQDQDVRPASPALVPDVILEMPPNSSEKAISVALSDIDLHALMFEDKDELQEMVTVPPEASCTKCTENQAQVGGLSAVPTSCVCLDITKEVPISHQEQRLTTEDPLCVNGTNKSLPWTFPEVTASLSPNKKKRWRSPSTSPRVLKRRRVVSHMNSDPLHMRLDERCPSQEMSPILQVAMRPWSQLADWRTCRAVPSKCQFPFNPSLADLPMECLFSASDRRLSLLQLDRAKSVVGGGTSDYGDLDTRVPSADPLGSTLAGVTTVESGMDVVCSPGTGPSHSSLQIEPDLLVPGTFSSESDWDCDLISRFGGPTGSTACHALDVDVLQLTCATVRDSGYDSRLCSVLRHNTELSWAATGSKDLDAVPFGRLQAWPV